MELHEVTTADTTGVDAPSDEMCTFFETRTRLHQARVVRNVERLAKTREAEPIAGQLAQRAAVHDASKWSSDE